MIPAVWNATTGEPVTQRKRAMVASTATAKPTVRVELCKRYLLAIKSEGYGERSQ